MKPTSTSTHLQEAANYLRDIADQKFFSGRENSLLESVHYYHCAQVLEREADITLKHEIEAVLMARGGT